MKAYDIFDAELARSVGTLLYFEKCRRFIVECVDWLDEWTAPLQFAGLVKQGIYTIPEEESGLWVRARLIPPSRQNIQAILRTHKLKEYSEIAFLELSEGKCSQDSISVRRIDELPPYVKERSRHCLKEVVRSGESLLCFFADGSLKKLSFEELAGAAPAWRHLSSPELWDRCTVGTGGYALSVGDAFYLPAAALYGRNTSAPVTLEDFAAFVRENTLDTAEACRLLECSRQNLAYLSGQERLAAVKEDVKGKLYLRGDLLKLNW